MTMEPLPDPVYERDRPPREWRVHRNAAAVIPLKPKRKYERKAFPVTVVQVDPDVWREAMRLAGGDAGRITVISPTRVEVDARRK